MNRNSVIFADTAAFFGIGSEVAVFWNTIIKIKAGKICKAKKKMYEKKKRRYRKWK